MEITQLICPYTETCLLYKNWTEKSRDYRLNIINKSSRYSCLALIAIQDPITEGGVEINEELSKRLLKPNDYECSHIELLNLSRREF